MLRYCLTLFLTLLTALSASAQRTLSGKITSANGKPLAGAIIQVYDGDKNVAFGNSRQDGSYKLTIPEANARRKLTVNVRKLNYANRTLDLPTGQTTLDAVLSPGEESLREVIVKAPAVEQSGDTLRFFMGQFATGTDVSLEDGLKRIPVSESGAISYMGARHQPILYRRTEPAGRTIQSGYAQHPRRQGDRRGGLASLPAQQGGQKRADRRCGSEHPPVRESQNQAVRHV